MKYGFMVLALVAAGVATMLMYDIAAPSAITDEAVVTGKTITRSGQHTTYYLQAYGQHRYHKKVDKKFFDTAVTGDVLMIELSRFFKEWKKMDLVRGDTVLAQSWGASIYWLGVLSIFFYVPLIGFLYYDTHITGNAVALTVVWSIAVIALIVAVRIWLAASGIIEKI